MKSLLAQCTLAALVAAGVSASMSLARDTRPGIAAQIDALGLDRAELRAKLIGMSREDRIAYLQSLGVHLPETLTRTDSPVTSPPYVPPDSVSGPGTVVIDPVAVGGGVASEVSSQPSARP